MITFEDFKKVEMRIGKVISCEKVENADKLLRLQVDFGEFQRQIVSGIAESFAPEELVGKTLPFVVNLEYRKFKGEESQGMLVATTSNVAGAGNGADSVILLEPSGEVIPGAEVV
ncbi:MAG: methionyl-tRNA synthetase [uncultured bacterium]|nr:MAG: methionyl-tRNA synthetase [uncultured bacterium]